MLHPLQVFGYRPPNASLRAETKPAIQPAYARANESDVRSVRTSIDALSREMVWQTGLLVQSPGHIALHIELHFRKHAFWSDCTKPALRTSHNARTSKHFYCLVLHARLRNAGQFGPVHQRR